MTANNKGTHLSFEDRKIIETGISNGSTKTAIAKTIGKDNSTVGKEIDAHRILKSKCPLPLECSAYRHCKLGRNCTISCPKYVPFKCTRRDRSPGACNGCSNYSRCRFDKYWYEAITAQKAAEQTAKVNPELDSIGAVSDAFGNPYFVTDFGTMEEDPAEVVYEISKMSDGKNFKISGEDEDTPVINEDAAKSELYKYIIYCGQRSASTFGMADQNVANSIDSGAGSVESSVPIWGGVADMLQGIKIKKNLGFVSGKACVTGNDGEGLGKDTFPWKRAKYYQRFIEDQRLAENMGLVEESSVSVALRHYYEKNPIDDSFEGLLSYYSGMSKEKVADSLDLLEASMWIAGYDPSGLYPINNKKLEALTRENAITIKEASSTNIITMSAPRVIYLSYRKEYSIG